MFSHIMIGARDLEKMVAFYDDVLSPLGMRRVVDMDEADEAGIIWRQDDCRWPQFALRRPFNGLPATWGNGVQISFATPSRAAVDLVWAVAIEKGAQDEGAPRLRLRYADDFYAAYCRDPEGNKLCFVHAEGLAARQMLLLDGVNMDRDDRLGIYLRYLELCNQHLFDQLGEYVAHDVGGSTKGLANYIRGCCDVVAAFPDYRWILQHTVVEDDWLAARLIGGGTHSGPFRGVPPTGKTIRTQEMVMYRFAKNKIAECWGDLHTTVRDERVSGN